MFDIEMLTDTLDKELSKLEIKLCYIALFEKTPGNESEPMNQSRLVFAYNLNKIKVDVNDNLYITSELLSGRFHECHKKEEEP